MQNTESAKRRFIAVQSVAKTEFGSGDAELLNDDAVVDQRESLLGHADHDFERRIDGGGVEPGLKRAEQDDGKRKPQ
jgi:hypothetical protein